MPDNPRFREAHSVFEWAKKFRGKSLRPTGHDKPSGVPGQDSERSKNKEDEGRLREILAGTVSFDGEQWLPRPNAIGIAFCSFTDEDEITYEIPIIGMNECVLINPNGEVNAIVAEWLERGTDRGRLNEETDFHRYWVPGLTLAQIVIEAEDGQPVFPNLIYFHKPNYTFHPDQAPQPVTSNRQKTAQLNPTNDPGLSVITLDTGSIEGQTDIECDYSKSPLDPYDDTEIVRGHGPAIADLIGHMLGDPERSILVGIDYAAGCTGQPMKVPHHKKFVGSDDAPFVRCFDTFALDHALSQVEAMFGKHPFKQDPVVVNLSLGTLSCDDLMANDPIGERLKRWVKSETIITVAAGNHYDSRPSFPAAYSADVSGIVSVGSTHGSFSATGKTVVKEVNGERVLVKYLRNGREREWSGTSFAAPQIAAQHAAGTRQL